MDTIAAKDLKQLLSALKLTLPKTATSQVLTTICFMDGKAKTYDGVCGTVMKSGLTISCCVPGEELISQVSKLDGEITLNQVDNMLHIAAGTFKAKFKTFEAVDFPDFIPKDRSELTDEQGIAAAIELVAAFASKEADALGGVCVVQDKVYSCNGRTVTKVLLQKPITHMIHIPERFAKALAKAGEPICLFRANDMVGAYYPDMVLITQQIVNRFPHETVETIFGIGDPEVELPEELGGVLKRISPSLTASGVVSLQSAGGKLSVATESAGEVLDWTGPEFKFNVEAKHLASAIELARVVRLGSVVSGENRGLVFVGANVLHALALSD